METLGSLPWDNMDPLHDYNKIRDYKLLIRDKYRQKFLENSPYEFSEILDIIDALGYIIIIFLKLRLEIYRFFDTPDYERIFTIIESIFERLDLKNNMPFDWEVCLLFTK